jgi:hypothetical protein
MKRWFLILVVAVVAILVIAAAVLVAPRPAFLRHREEAFCVGNMQQVVLGAVLWSKDHNGRFPSDFLSMSNELSTPWRLVCPGDRVRKRVTDWALFTTNNCSYEIVTSGISEADTNLIFLRCKIHGYTGYSDRRLLNESGRVLYPR